MIYDQFISPFLVQHAAKFDPVFATTKLVSSVDYNHSSHAQHMSKFAACVAWVQHLRAFLPPNTCCQLACTCVACSADLNISTLQAIDNAQIDRLVALAQQYGPEVAKGAIVKVM